MRRLPLTQGMHMNDSKNKYRARSIAQKAVAVLVCLAMASLQMPLVGSAFAESANAAATEQQQTEAPAQATDADAQTQPATPEADEKASASDEQAEEPEAATSTKNEAAPAAAAKAVPLRAPQAPAANTFPSAPPTSTFDVSAFNKLPGGKLGVLANFGLIGFESIYGNTHINSNVATETFYANSVTFGTNNLAEPEVSYIGTKVVGGANVNMKDGSGKYNGSSVVLGSGSKVEVLGDNPDSVRQVKVDGDHFDINGPSSAQEQRQSIYQEQADQKYLDLASLQSQMGSVSREIASMAASGTTVDFNHENNQKITIDKDAKVSVAKLTAGDLNKWGDPRRIQVTGDYDTSVKRLIVIDIDAQGASSIKIPKVEVKGGSSGGVSTWANTNVIFNVHDSTVADGQYRGTVTNSDAMYGVILAPYGTVDATSNVNGQIIANKIIVDAEFHRDSFTYNDETITTGAALTVKGSKTLDGTAGNIPSFSFTMTAKGDAPMPTGSEDGSITVTNSDSGDISFGQITYSKAGTYEYTIAEVQDGTSSYDYDTRSYTMTVSVSVDNQASTSTKTVYKIDKVLSKSSELLASDKEISPASGTDSTYNVATFANKTHKDLKTSYQIGGTKELSGRSFKSGDSWTFTLSAPEGTPLPQNKTVTVSPTQGTEWEFKFDSIEYGAGDIDKTYTYTVTESGSAAGVTNDADSHTVTVTIGKDDKSGAPVVNAKYANGDASGNLLRFVNTYHASGSTDLTATKNLVGRSFKTGDSWTFDVVAKDADAPLPANRTVTITPESGTSAAVDFGAISFGTKDIGKTYTYSIIERGTIAGVTNDAQEHIVKLSVSDDDHDGKIEVTRTDEGAGTTFTNTYTAAGTFTMQAAKHLVGRDFQKGDHFTFVLSSTSANAPMPEKDTVEINPESGSEQGVYFGDINYTLADAGHQYTYRVDEAGSGAGITNDSDNHIVTVDVADAGDGTLTITPTYSDGGKGMEFTNKYQAAKCKATIQATKYLFGKYQTDGEFTFDLTDADGNVVQEQTNNANGEVTFDAIEYDTPGVYTYHISEVNSGEEDIEYDTHVEDVKVTVTEDKATAQLTSNVEYTSKDGSPDSATFANSYFKSEVNFEVAKMFHGSNASQDFTFKVVALDGGPLPVNDEVTVTAASGQKTPVKFDTITFDRSMADKTFRYQIVEENDGQSGVSYDATAFEAQVKVGSVMSGGEPTVTWSTVSNGVSSQVDASDLVFYNNQRIRLNARFMAMNRGHVSMAASKVRVEPTVHKELVGASLNSGEFTFELTGADENGQTIDKTATNDENGTVDFFTGDDMLTFTKPGTYAYQISEKAGDDSSISYDDRTITYTVVVAKDQQGSLYAQQSYTDSSLDGAVVTDPKFVNTELLNVRVQKTSREGGEGLYDALYGLYMENPDGSGNDALVGQASSDKDGWVTIKDVHPNFDAVYYFKEIKAPAGHTVDPYKTDRFMIVSNNGTYQLKYLDR